MINWQDIDLKGRTSGTLKTVCPNCSHTRKKKTDPCLSVNISKGAARCWNCEEISWRDYSEPTKEKEYDLPPPQWQNFTNLSDAMVKYFANRGINQATLIANKVTEERAFIPRDSKEMNCIVFNYFYHGTLVNKKYRSGTKGFTQVKNAKKVFYNIDNLIGESECYITEGEVDVLSLWQIGITNAISVPNGAKDMNDVFDTCQKELGMIDTFIIAVDMDEPGIQLEQELIKRFGKHKCKRVKFVGKDANEDLIAGVLEESIGKLFDYPVEGTFTTVDLSDEIDDLYDNGLPPPMRVKADWASKLNECWGILKGQLDIWTGIPSHGKSNFVEWYLLNLICEQQLKASFYSPEHLPMKLHHAYLAEKVIGKPFQGDIKGVKRMTRDELADYKEWASTRLYLTAPENGVTPTWEWIFNTFREQLFKYGIDIFVIDAFNKVKRQSDSLMEISDVLSDLSLFCQVHNVNIILIAHPTKMRKKDKMQEYEVPTLYDVKGSGDFADQAHNGAVIYRYFGDDGFTEFIPLKLKFRHQGTVSGQSASFQYDVVNGRYYRRPDGKPNYDSLIHPKQKKSEPVQRLWWKDNDDELFAEQPEDKAPF